MVSGCPFLVQVTVVAMEPVDSQVRVVDEFKVPDDNATTLGGAGRRQDMITALPSRIEGTAIRSLLYLPLQNHYILCLGITHCNIGGNSLAVFLLSILLILQINLKYYWNVNLLMYIVYITSISIIITLSLHTPN